MKAPDRVGVVVAQRMWIVDARPRVRWGLPNREFGSLRSLNWPRIAQPWPDRRELEVSCHPGGRDTFENTLGTLGKPSAAPLSFEQLVGVWLPGGPARSRPPPTPQGERIAREVLLPELGAEDVSRVCSPLGRAASCARPLTRPRRGGDRQGGDERSTTRSA